MKTKHFLSLFLLLIIFKTEAKEPCLLAKKLKTPVYCEGTYSGHLQGFDVSEESIFWSWTTKLVKTDFNGKLQISVDADNHHGDLCTVGERVFVAVNLGKFNQPTGQAKSWVYEYDTNSLELLNKHPVPEVVHGAGGIAWKDESFFVVGGLPKGYEENYIYEYDETFRFEGRHVLNSGYTLLGIQTITWAKDKWWFGCYGKPDVLLTADKDFSLIAKDELNAALGISFINDTPFIGSNKVVDGKYRGAISPIELCNNSKGLQEIIIGGDDQVMILDFENSVDSVKNIKWQIKTSEIISLPDSISKHLKTVDDHKSVDNNSKILICSSGGATVMVDRATKESLFYAITPNAHSIEYLPNNRIVVALSTAKNGNSIKLYDADKSNIVLFKDSLYSGHGVTWLEKRELLYALGNDELRAYSLLDWNTERPSLKLENMWKLPEAGGHDLFASSDNQLIISTSNAVWKFKLNSNVFEPFEPIANVPNVKSIYYNEKTEHLIYTKGEISWWTHNIYSLNPTKVIKVPEIDVYKIRLIE